MAPQDSARFSELMRLAGGARRQRDFAAAQALVEQAHGLSQNDPYLHFKAHLARTCVFAHEGRKGAAVMELRLAGLAPVASGLRRVSGYAPGQDNPPSMWRTWRERRDWR